MNITDLEDALCKLNLSTTGNKTQLKMRLQNAYTQKQTLDVVNRDTRSELEQLRSDKDTTTNEDMTTDEDNQNELPKRSTIGRTFIDKTQPSDYDESIARRARRIKSNRARLLE